jgi:predicted transposase YbfD/YdcC
MLVMESVLAIFAAIDDPRDHTSLYELPSLLFIALAATLCGARSCVEIADFAEANRADLTEIIDLPGDATPSHDTFSRLFRLLDPEHLESALRRFAAAMREGLGLSPSEGVVAVDGKRLRRAYERGRAHMPPLMVGVWDAETRLSIAARAGTDGNEVAATLAVLKTVSLKRCTVTGDALHCHPEMARHVRAQGGHYLFKLKANNGPLLAAAKAAFTAAEAGGTLKWSEREDDANDRIERRRGCVFAHLAGTPAFPDLMAFGRLDSERTKQGGKTETKTHYLVMSERLPAWRMMAMIRRHWSVENHLHRQLDVVFREDDARARKNHASTNLSVIRRMALDMLQAHPLRRSPARKMNLARWKRSFFFELFTYVR